MTVGLSCVAIFGDFDSYFFGNFRGKAGIIMAIRNQCCRLVSDCKMNDLE